MLSGYLVVKLESKLNMNACVWQSTITKDARNVALSERPEVGAMVSQHGFFRFEEWVTIIS